MPQLDTQPVGESQIQRFIDEKSDFAFEMEVLAELKKIPLKCEHGGTYDDPVTKLPRQFDIRAYGGKPRIVIRLALECKRLSENFPLVVSRVPRVAGECYQMWIHSAPGDNISNARTERMSTAAFDQLNFYVGKSTSQVGVTKNGEISANDAEVYNKWAQAIASSHDLVKTAEEAEPGIRTTVVPVLVVPDKRLWVVDFDKSGRQQSKPTQTDQCSLFIDKTHHVPLTKGMDTIGNFLEYTQSHLEIVTFSALRNLWHSQRVFAGLDDL